MSIRRFSVLVLISSIGLAGNGCAITQGIEVDCGIKCSESNVPHHTSLSEKSQSEPWWLDVVNARCSSGLAIGSGVTVAVIDSGVDLDHFALNGQIHTDGYNFGDCIPGRMPLCSTGTDTQPVDKLGHGTYIAGIIAARLDGDGHYHGLSPGAKILPIKVNPGMMDDFSADSLARAIIYAKSHGAKVINLSLDMPVISDNERKRVEDALQQAIEAQIFIVVASGNRAREVSFPGDYPGVITVAGINESGLIDRRSNLGKAVAIAAPIGNIESTIMGGGLGTRGGGTSYSAPFVSATLANMLQIKPDLSLEEAIEILRKSATPFKAEPDADFGILNVCGALDMVSKLRSEP